MNRFLKELNDDIAEIMKHHNYDSIEDMVEKAIQIECRLKSKADGRSNRYEPHGNIVKRPTQLYRAMIRRLHVHIVDTTSMQIEEVNCIDIDSINCDIGNVVAQKKDKEKLDMSMVKKNNSDEEDKLLNGAFIEGEVWEAMSKLMMVALTKKSKK